MFLAITSITVPRKLPNMTLAVFTLAARVPLAVDAAVAEVCTAELPEENLALLRAPTMLLRNI
jgi:hypothetical protein